MIRTIFLSVVLACNCCFAQQKDSLRPAKVTNWARLSARLTENFWNSAKKDIVAQIGEAGFENVRKFSKNSVVPSALQMWDGRLNQQKVEDDEYYKRMASLKVYKFIDFSRVNFKGDTIKHTVLAVPHQELYWEKDVKWDTVYLIIESEFVK